MGDAVAPRVPLTKPGAAHRHDLQRTDHLERISASFRLTQTPNKRILPLALWTFQGQYSVNTPAVLAAVLLTTLRILLPYIIGRRQMVIGLSAGFSK